MEDSCHNDLWIDGNDISTLFWDILGDEDGQDLLIDFNKIIPMPEELDVPGMFGIPRHRAIAIAKNDFGELVDDNLVMENNITTIEELCSFFKTKEGGECDIEALRRLGNVYLRNLSKYGFSDWMSWQQENWGCSSAQDTRVIHDTSRNIGIRFSTLYDPPTKIIKALAIQFPKNTFTLRYYNYDAGREGCLKVKGEQVLEESHAEHYKWWDENHVVEGRM